MEQEKRKEVEKTRRFLGNVITAENRNKFISQYTKDILENAAENDKSLTYEQARRMAKDYINKETKHLKAFIRGKRYYRYGLDTQILENGVVVKTPGIFAVQTEYK